MGHKHFQQNCHFQDININTLTKIIKLFLNQ